MGQLPELAEPPSCCYLDGETEGRRAYGVGAEQWAGRPGHAAPLCLSQYFPVLPSAPGARAGADAGAPQRCSASCSPTWRAAWLEGTALMESLMMGTLSWPAAATQTAPLSLVRRMVTWGQRLQQPGGRQDMGLGAASLRGGTGLQCPLPCPGAMLMPAGSPGCVVSGGGGMPPLPRLISAILRSPGEPGQSRAERLPCHQATQEER